MPYRLDLTGHRYGRLVVLGFTGAMKRYRGAIWRCRCDCGEIVEVSAGAMRGGDNSSCGCYQTERRIARKLVHGHARKGHVTPERYIWNAMHQRCRNPKNKSFHNYGARGVTVCDEWKDFAVFLRDMGTRPSPLHSIDRINNAKGYEPGNCRWATRTQQNQNRRPHYEWRSRE